MFAIMLRAAAFLQKSIEADLAAEAAASIEDRDRFEAIARSWRRMAEDVFMDHLPPARLAA
jgi:hypothetical protein